MKYALRDYQTNLIQAVLKSWETHRRVKLQLATGGGKTVLFAHLALKFIREGMGVLVLAHREELLLQAKEKLEEITGLPTGIIKAGLPFYSHYDLQVASVQSLIRRKYTPDAGLLIVDESHHANAATYTKLMERYPEAKILGCTATPHRIDDHGFQWLFDDLICGPSTKELIQQGFLSPYKLFQAAKVAYTEEVKTSSGDFNLGDLGKSVSSQVEAVDVVAEWKKQAQGLKTIVFAVDIARSLEYKEAFQLAGVAAEHLDGETRKEERKAILERFSIGETLVLCNCGIISEGFDMPSVEAVQIVRPTQSLTMWLQMVGRGLRISEGKDSTVIIDHTKNWLNLGVPDDERIWSLNPQPLTEDAQRFLHVVCGAPLCHHIYKPTHEETTAAQQSSEIIIDPKTGTPKKVGSSICPSCSEINQFLIGTGGVSFEKIVEANTLALRVDLEVDPENRALIDKLLIIKHERGYKAGWVYCALKDLSEGNVDGFSIHNLLLGDWLYLGNQLGYKPGWGYKNYQETRSGESFDTPNHWSKTPIFNGLIENLDTRPLLMPIKKAT